MFAIIGARHFHKWHPIVNIVVYECKAPSIFPQPKHDLA